MTVSGSDEAEYERVEITLAMCTRRQSFRNSYCPLLIENAS